MKETIEETEPWKSLFARLRNRPHSSDSIQNWPHEPLLWCGEAGLHRWFIEPKWGGLGWSELQVTEGYLTLGRICMTTAFIVTQRTGAMKRIACSNNQAACDRWLHGLVHGTMFGTVGISHLTTSRQFVSSPVLKASRIAKGYCLNGYSPWVTGGCHADVLVVGAVLEGGEQILVALPGNRRGITAHPGNSMVALTASCTGRVDFDSVEIEEDEVLAGPSMDVMRQGIGAGTGGLQTSTLAVGLSQAAISLMQEEMKRRNELEPIVGKLLHDSNQLVHDLLQVASGDSRCTPAEIRARANSLALRSTQAALTTTKGAGFVDGHPAGRWAREALFFLVWSCPQPILHANLCELAGLEGS